MNIDSQKICFISCINNEKYEAEKRKYLNNLIVPEGFTVEMCSVKNADSMAAGYNTGMHKSNAKYKVYLHQDVFIVNPSFIQDILAIFQNREIGMIGMVGICDMPESAIMWDGPRIGKIYASCIYESRESIIGEVNGLWESVEAVDGLLMATQYDIPWRDDLFQGWDFYDISQSREFKRKGYKIVVPNQTEPWCIHDEGFYNLKNYYYNRRIYKNEYV